MAESLFISPTPPPLVRIKDEDNGSIDLNYENHHAAADESGSDDEESGSRSPSMNNSGESQVGAADEVGEQINRGNNATIPNDMSDFAPLATEDPQHPGTFNAADTHSQRSSSTHSTPTQSIRVAHSGSSRQGSGSLSPAMLDIIRSFLDQLEHQHKRDMEGKYADEQAAIARELAAGRAANARELAAGKATVARELANGQAALTRELAAGKEENAKAIKLHYTKYSDAKSADFDDRAEKLVQQGKEHYDREMRQVQDRYERGCEELVEKHQESVRAVDAEFDQKVRSLNERYEKKKQHAKDQYTNGAAAYQKELDELDENVEKERAQRMAALDVKMEQEEKKRLAALEAEMDRARKEEYAALKSEMAQERLKLAALKGQVASIMDPPNTGDAGSASSLEAPLPNVAPGTLSQVHQTSFIAC